MVRTKWCPRPFVDHFGTTVARLSSQSNENVPKNSTFKFPKRTKLKARRRFTGRQESRNSLKSPPTTDSLSRNLPSHYETNKLSPRLGNRHKRQKSLHRVFAKVQVNNAS